MKGAKIFLPVLLAFLPAVASAATLAASAPSAAVVGQSFNVEVQLSTAAGESANAVSGTVTYPANLLTLTSISKAGIITLWPSDPSHDASSAQFEGVILNPGYSGQGGTVLTLMFVAKAAGTAPIAFSDASVLANDGNATPILSGTKPGSVTIAPAAAPSTTTAPPANTPAKTSAQTTAPATETNVPAATTSTIELTTTPTPEPVVEGDLLSTIYQFAIANGPLVLLGIALVLALFLFARFLLWYPFIPVRKAGRVRRDISSGLHEHFDELRDALTEGVFALEHAKTKRDLTDEEERFLLRFQKLLAKTERDLQKELS
jgi:hypothetical protein